MNSYFLKFSFLVMLDTVTKWFFLLNIVGYSLNHCFNCQLKIPYVLIEISMNVTRLVYNYLFTEILFLFVF